MQLQKCFVDKFKADGSKKTGLCIAATHDREHGLCTAAPSIKGMSMRLMLAVRASMKFIVYTRDVKKAFIMSKMLLRLLDDCNSDNTHIITPSGISP